ncbi:hypothetical protein LNKW23_38020 [Paralimibaculum aggregatum]|uniref:Sulfoxide reductase heme-binding subunit YedZ n=1 Tax=Paralimibaculum aggregatum TaxID=3036245 RepID=A0ABQ6LN16_9RHOB|nr:iron reductase [Limibaculum sp. NKW23]GMG84586.1 hypothetical protein LNKW23_38020 [Limibaculum sp. NKW23]
MAGRPRLNRDDRFGSLAIRTTALLRCGIRPAARRRCEHGTSGIDLEPPHTFWALLSLPAIPIVTGFASDDPRAVHEMLHPTGEFAARFMIVAMTIAPMTVLLRGWRGPRWMMKRRRRLGVAAFGCAALHMVLYLIDKGAVAFTPGRAIQSLHLDRLDRVPDIRAARRDLYGRLGPRWKMLQRFVYGAAVLTLLHWAALHDWGGVGPAMVHFAPLVLLEAYRLWSTPGRRRLRVA